MASHLSRSTDCKCPTLGWGRSTERSTVSLGTVDRAIDRPESNCSLDLARSTGRSTGRLNGQKFDRWPVDRKAILGLVSCQFDWAYKYPNLWPVLKRFFKRKISYFLSVLTLVFQRVFGLRDQSSFVFKVFVNSKKIVF